MPEKSRRYNNAKVRAVLRYQSNGELSPASQFNPISERSFDLKAI